jgi:actin-related protein
MIEDYTTKESFEVISMFYTTILFTLKRMLISMVRSKIAQIKNRSSGCSVPYHNFAHFEAKIHINGMIQDYTTKESFEGISMSHTTILFTLKRMLISMVRSKIAQIKNRSSGCSVLYHNLAHFKAITHTNGMIEDYTTKESFEVISMFYTTILFTLKRMLISMVRSKIAQIKNRSSGCSGLYNNFVHFEAMAHTNDMIEDCTTKELFESGGIFFTTILFALK